MLENHDRYNSQDGGKKKCFICNEPGCWSTKHSKEKRDKSKKKFKERFSQQFAQQFDRHTNQYITDYEGSHNSEAKDDLNNAIEALIINIESPPTIPVQDKAEWFFCSSGTIYQAEAITSDLANCSLSHAITGTSPVTGNDNLKSNPFAYTMSNHYTSKEFYGVMIDTGASKRPTAGYEQYLAYKKINNIPVDISKAGAVHVQFGIGSTLSIGSIIVNTSVGRIEFHIVKADTSFLLCIADMDNLKVYYNNLENVLVTPTKLVPVTRQFGHPFLLWEESLQSFIANSFNLNPCYLTDTELRQLHRRFGHPSANRLRLVLERSGHGDNLNKKTLEHLTKYCSHCQKHGKSPGRFKFILRDDVNFNYSIIVDIMYIDNSPILHIVDEATRFQAAKWLSNISAKHTWDILRLCWIDVYIGPPDYIIHDAGKNFISREFRQYAASMAITTKSVPVEAHWSIGMVERYHAVLRRAYKVIMDKLQGSGINKDMALQMAVKAVNDTAGPNGLVPTLLVFGAYPWIHELDPPAPTVSQRAMAIRKAMEEVRRIRAERQVTDALNQRNGPSVSILHDLPLNSDVLVWREGNAGRSGRWTGPFKLLGIDGETCKVELPSGPTDFRSTMVKPYLTEAEEENSGQEEQQDHDQEDQDKSSQEEQEDPLQEHPLQPVAARQNADRPWRLPLRYQNIADVLILLQGQNDAKTLDEIELFECNSPLFTKSRQKEISRLFRKGVFKIINIADFPKGVRIFNSRFVDEIQNIDTDKAFKKSRLVVQAYNDYGKELVLTQLPTIQWMSQRLILAIAATL